MALTKDIVQSTGFAPQYWRLTQFVINPIEKEMFLVVSGFKSKADFDNGAAAATVQNIRVDKDTLLALTTPNVVPTLKAALNTGEAIAKELVLAFADAIEDPNDVI